jgi:hypothetical protein
VKTAGLLTFALALATAPASAQSVPAVKDTEWCKAFDPQKKDPGCVFPVLREPPAKPVTVKPIPLLLLPPAAYDRPFDGYQEVVRPKTEQELREQCDGAKFGPTLGPMACSMKLVNRKAPSLKGCRIVINSDEYLKKYGIPYDVVLRHELGHCNGWPSDHPGALPFVDWAE